MFNFFESLKKENKVKSEKLGNFNIVYSDGNLIYIEGHKGLLKLEQDVIVVKIKKGIVCLKGNNMALKDLKKDTITIEGNIKNIEVI